MDGGIGISRGYFFSMAIMVMSSSWWYPLTNDFRSLWSSLTMWSAPFGAAILNDWAMRSLPYSSWLGFIASVTPSVYKRRQSPVSRCMSRGFVTLVKTSPSSSPMASPGALIHSKSPFFLMSGALSCPAQTSLMLPFLLFMM